MGTTTTKNDTEKTEPVTEDAAAGTKPADAPEDRAAAQDTTPETAAGTEETGAEESVIEDAPTAAAPVRRGIAAGAGAVAGAALGLASLTGTWAGTILAERQTVLGQIKLQTGKTQDQIAAVYTTPWHTTALVNGIFAVLALVVTGAVLLRRPQAAWTRAVAWGGFALAVLGLVIAGGMYLDLFASAPKLSPGGS
ncbi:hypothetical protein [Streptomyces purpurogeneiscleroticus]|uniref:hypothetical protein n=1 Tax=Streptomyces purpurogeneiscleroticus TaxID=68259 RepID=UPI001CBD8CFB|nr:hypothetical protein [Streptomyces purpurogeneiscleroticus]MBZ4019466.1 hypothetical protein [Streptomyces purpurogeneiscleroticus]